MDKQLQRFPGVVFGTLITFILATTISLVLPLFSILNQDKDKASVKDLAVNPANSGFAELADLYPEQFERFWPEGPTPANYAKALEQGYQVYIKNACFQCHTQNVRLFEASRYGNPSTLIEQNNDLQHPAVFGNRRIGPDLARVGATYPASFYADYFYDPQNEEIFPETEFFHQPYRWLFEEEGVLKEDGFALISYLIWLGDYQPVATADESAE
jgi:hypothetical protein